MNKAKTLKMKIVYVIAALAMLAMLIPAMAVPVSAADSLTMEIQNIDADGVVTWLPDGTLVNGIQEGYNVAGSVVRITASSMPTLWALSGAGQWYGADPNSPLTDVAYVTGFSGESTISATIDSTVYMVKKKWGTFTTSFPSQPGQTSITWNESSKSWYGAGQVVDLASGIFINGPHAAQGAILSWYLIANEVDLSTLTGTAGNMNDQLANTVAYPRPQHVEFIDSTTPGFDQWDRTSPGWLGTDMIRNTTDADGTASVNLGAWWKEAVQIVIIPDYPNHPNIPATPEITSYNFRDLELAVVPQVRWVGEKIVLEANFGASFNTSEVEFFFQNQSVGTLEGIDGESEAESVWAYVNSDGIASAILTSYVSGQVDVAAALYSNGSDQPQTNQYAFRVYFLDFYSLTLGDANGKRAQHNAGLWEPSDEVNIWDGFVDWTTDLPSQIANVSQDTLERAVVKGWFMPAGAKKSSRAAANIDLDGDGSTLLDADMDDMIAPAGHYVLPDDWAYIGGYTSWQTKKLHWDIMDNPMDTIAAVTSPLGDYKTNYGAGTLVAPANTIGPFAPDIEVMTPYGWMVNNPPVDNWTIPGSQPAVYPRHINTVVPNGELDLWDAPMPPAKISFQIIGATSAGYFKTAYKKDIYYMTVGSNTVYTAPFYQILIPAHEALVPFNIGPGGGYDWNSFNGVDGPYEFWRIINRPNIGVTNPVGTPGDAAHPTYVEVYSDNHGEAMVYLNGDWNLDLSDWVSESIEVTPGATVAYSTVRASADNPYVRSEQVIFSNTVEKEWFWSGQTLGMEFPYTRYDGATDPGWYRMVLATGDLPAPSTWIGTAPYEKSDSSKRMVWVWLSDRDGLQAGTLGSLVEWRVSANGQIPNITSSQISSYNEVTRAIAVENGFLAGTKYLTVPGDLNSYRTSDWRIGYAKTRAPTDPEKELFRRFYGNQYAPGTTFNLSADNFSVAAIELDASTDAFVDVTAYITTPREGTHQRHVNVPFDTAERMDDPLMPGDANGDGVVNMADVVMVERIILGLAPRSSDANASWDYNPDHSLNIDMGDVVRIEKIILTGN